MVVQAQNRSCNAGSGLCWAMVSGCFMDVHGLVLSHEWIWTEAYILLMLYYFILLSCQHLHFYHFCRCLQVAMIASAQAARWVLRCWSKWPMCGPHCRENLAAVEEFVCLYVFIQTHSAEVLQSLDACETLTFLKKFVWNHSFAHACAGKSYSMFWLIHSIPSRNGIECFLGIWDSQIQQWFTLKSTIEYILFDYFPICSHFSPRRMRRFELPSCNGVKLCNTWVRFNGSI